MPFAPINITLGTAGHIDHGKTALVKSLTGCETDRLKEEKERGMSIDLGFAPCHLADLQVGIVDVPGHEHFIKTMVAGASAMDGVILVVAADDGVMPQTREHLEILTLLGVRHGLIAMTKIDRVEPDHLELARADVEEMVRGTFLAGAPVLPISNVTGEGFDRFFEGLLDLVRSIRPKPVDGLFRLPLDRAFSVQGYGTVVAGVPVSGSARAGDEVELLPQGLSGRIRRIEVYGRPSDSVLAGQCAAINVGHWEPDRMRRGDVIATPGYFAAAEWYVGTLRLLTRDKLLVKNGAEVKFHTGTSEVAAVVYSLSEGPMRGGGDYVIQVRTVHPIVAGPGDRFILRSLSPVRTIGGGTIIESVTRRLKRGRSALCEELLQRADVVSDPGRFVEYCVRTAEPLAATAAELAVRCKVPQARLLEILAELARQGKVRPLANGRYVDPARADQLNQRVLAAMAELHRQSPESPGATLDQLRQACPINKDLLDGLLAPLKADGRVVEQKGRLALAEHRATFAHEDAKLLEAVESLFREHSFHPPAVDEIAAKTGATADKVQRGLRLLVEHRRLVKIEDLLFHCEAVDRARQILIDHLRKEGRLDSVDFKYLLDTTRKFALPLLDYFDRTGVTIRSGNTRYPRTPPAGGTPRG